MAVFIVCSLLAFVAFLVYSLCKYDLDKNHELEVMKQKEASKSALEKCFGRSDKNESE